MLSSGVWWIGEGARFFVPLLLFGYQSLEWWYSVPRSTAVNSEILPSPEAPKVRQILFWNNLSVVAWRSSWTTSRCRVPNLP